MSKVSDLMHLMHKFTPEGHGMLIKVLKENKSTLKKEFGFAELPTIISDKGMTDTFEKELTDKNKSIRNIVSDFLNYILRVNVKKNTSKGQEQKTIQKLIELAKQADKNSKFNPRGKGAFIATKHFEQKKQKFLKLIEEKCGKRGKNKFIDMTPENIDKYFAEQNMTSVAYVVGHPFRAIQMFFKRKKEQDRFGVLLSELMLETQKIFLNPSKDKRVKNIERILRQKYGFKYVHLDNCDDAEKILKTVEIAQKNNIPIVENIVVTPFIESRIAGVNLPYGKTIFINTNKGLKNVKASVERLQCSNDFKEAIKASNIESFINQYSTSHSLHAYLHEFIHPENPKTELDIIIPKKFKKTVENLGGYAKDSFNVSNEEIRVELRVKQILEKLKPDEEELLNILQSAIK